MSQHWEHALYTGNKYKHKMIKFCFFVWTRDPGKGSSAFLPQFASEEDWVCQALVLFVNDKIPEHWRRGNMLSAVYQELSLCFHIHTKGKYEESLKEKPWDPLSCTPPPYNPQVNPLEGVGGTKQIIWVNRRNLPPLLVCIQISGGNWNNVKST